MFQFWFNTFFVYHAATNICENEQTLQVFELDQMHYFDIGKENLDKAYKDTKGNVYPSNFKVRFWTHLRRWRYSTF